MPERVLVIGGGPAGLEAARAIASIGGRGLLVERRDVLGGAPDESNYAALTPRMGSAQEALDALRAGVEDPSIDVRRSTTVTACSGSVGDFRVTLSGPGGESTESVGAIVVATGFQHFDPGRETQMYGYYEYPDVITLPDPENILKYHLFFHPSTLQPPP